MQSLRKIIFKCFQLSDPVSATTSNGLRLPFSLMFDVSLSCPPFSSLLNCCRQSCVPTDHLFVFNHACFTYHRRNEDSFSELLMGEGEGGEGGVHRFLMLKWDVIMSQVAICCIAGSAKEHVALLRITKAMPNLF